MGSSPLARGLPGRVRQHRPQRRIIPARAGFTRVHERYPRRRPDHPRSRGVYWDRLVSNHAEEGSSPLARGLRKKHYGELFQGGIIPARAGFTTLSLMRSPPRGGSSPLARGLRILGGGDLVVPRIIPARAGFTAARAPQVTGTADHPRSRGVYSTRRLYLAAAAGSSPLARGLRVQVEDLDPPPRIIPARAGFTGIFEAFEGPGRDHPRSRGVYASPRGPPRHHRGSSPLARGLHARRRLPPPPRGIIPARAGFTHP